ncbi:Wzz/FepE/Etk N-terminal domain-containing protein [bacterium]|nr:Wzz/FepE/Etk N-terminal domain-containing protein [bacterium]
MNEKQEEFDDEIDLLQLFLVLWKQKFKIAFVTLLIAGIGVFYAINLPNIYTASAIFLPPKGSDNKMSSMMASLSAIPFFPGMGGGGGSENAFDILQAYLKKYENVWKVIDQFKLKEHYEIESDFKIDLEKSYLKNLNIDKDKKSGIVTLSFSDEDPELAAKIANFNVKLLTEISMNSVLSENKKKKIFITKRLKSSKEGLRKIEEEIRDYEKSNRILSIESQSKATIEAIAKIQSEMQLSLVKIKVQIALGANENHPQVRLLRLQNKELEKQLVSIQNGSLILSPNMSKEDQEKGLSYIPLQKIPQIKLDLERLMRKKIIELEIFKILTKEMEMVKIETSKELELLEVIEWARTPEKKSKPRRAIICIVVALSGFLLACFVVLVMNAFHERKETLVHD